MVYTPHILLCTCKDMTDNDNIIDANEAARILGVTRAGIGYLIKVGKLTGKRIGKNWALDRGEVEEYGRVRQERNRDEAKSHRQNSCQ